VELLNRFLKLEVLKRIYYGLFSSGVAVFVYYCVRIGFLPTGLSLSDVIFFFMVIMSFSLFLLFFLLCWYSISVVISNFAMKFIIFVLQMRKIKDKRLLRQFKGINLIAERMGIYSYMPYHYFIALTGGLVIFSGINSGKIDTLSVTLSIMIMSICISLVPHAYTDRRIKRGHKKNHLISLVVFSIFIFFTLSGMPPVLNDTSMSYIGFRKYDVTVTLEGSDLEMARYLTGNKNQTHFKCDALFTGIGSTSLLEIKDKRIIVKNSGMSLAY
jgi:hypothetical protein